MKRLHGILVLVILLAWTAPAPAQLFAKKVKPNPSQRVPELILILKTDPDEKKRAHAAEEIRDYDATLFTEILPVLVEVLQQDKKMNVRMEAVNSLAKIRPVNGMAGHALEKAAGNDESWRVRLQAKTALTKYHWSGYSAAKTDMLPTPSKKTTAEPPLATLAPPVIPNVAPNDAPPRPLPLTPASGPIARPLPTGPPNDAPPALPTAPNGPNMPAQGPSLFP
jgi:HEAT repeats